MSQIPIWKRLVKRAADQLNGTMLVSDAVTLLTAKDERIAFLEAENKRLDRRHVEFMVEGGPVVMKAEYDALEAQVSALEDTVKRLSKPDEWLLLPNEQGWWWHWNGEDLAIPHIFGILLSKTGPDRYFIQYPDGRWCDEVDGFWLKMQFPNVPSRDEQKSILASRSLSPEMLPGG